MSNRNKNNHFDDYFYGYEDVSFKKIHTKGAKPKRKGHQSRHNNDSAWDDLILSHTITYEEDTSSHQPNRPENASRPDRPRYQKSQDTPTSPINGPYAAKTPSPQQSPRPTQNTFQFGPNTHEIKGVKIDLDGVSFIESVDNEKDGHMTYGIKFHFKGNKGLYRIIWFNRNIYDRDCAYAAEFTAWTKLQALNTPSTPSAPKVLHPLKPTK